MDWRDIAGFKFIMYFSGKTYIASNSFHRYEVDCRPWNMFRYQTPMCTYMAWYFVIISDLSRNLTPRHIPTDRTNIHNTVYHDIDYVRVMWVRCSYKISCCKVSQFRSHAMCTLGCHIVLNFDRRIGGSGATKAPAKFHRDMTILTQSCAFLKLWDLAIRSHIGHYWNMPMIYIW